MSEEKAAKTTDDGDVVKWYTRARKFPQLIGKTPDGTRIWGGPYTVTQMVGGGSVLFVGLRTMSLWADFGLIGNFLLLGLITWGTVLLLGRIPVGSRNPLSVAAGTYRAVAAPALGRLGGRPVRIRRPHTLQHRVIFAVSDLPTLDPAVATAARTATTSMAPPQKPLPDGSPAGRPAATPAEPPAPDPSTRKPALTGVQALLAGKALPTHNQED